MLDLSNRWYIDGQDLWQTYKLVIEKGSNELLQMPQKKESITHDWIESNGIEVDLSHMYFKEREVTISFAMLAGSEPEFWQKYSSFITLLQKPGLRRLEIKAHGQRSYSIFYKSSGAFDAVTRFEGKDGDKLMGSKFAITFVEPNPQPGSNGNVFIVDEAGRFLIS